jgi:hypothetical protein
MDLGYPDSLDDQGNEKPVGYTGWLDYGLERLKSIHDTGNRIFVEEKAQMPKGALTAGGTAAMKPITSYDDANNALRERLRQQS